MDTMQRIETQGNIFGIALNYKNLYAAFRQQFNHPPYIKEPIHAVMFIKTPNTRNRSGCPVIKRQGDDLEPGPCLGIVMGTNAFQLNVDQVQQHIAGYVVVNEWSLHEDSYYRPTVKAKCQDGFCVIGTPVSKHQVKQIDQLDLRVFVNGILKQQGTTADWIRSPAQIIAEITQYMPLYRGDIILTGSPEGRISVQHGDEVRVEIDQLGEVVNSIWEYGI